VRYVSTRGDAPVLGFNDAILTGLARDGGLYLPEEWPAFSKAEITALRGRPYADVAFEVIRRFTGGEIADDVLRRLVDEAYGTFRHAAVAPLVQLGSNHFVLELFHGPTLAFKDVAMQLLARLMDHVLAERSARATIIGATSGDTGGAAIDAFKGRDRVDIAILFPDGKVSPVQRRQMTTVDADNVLSIAIKGNFDDAQSLVKEMFNDFKFRERVHLSGVNSINWGRIVAQSVYYFTAALSLGAPDRPVSFTVPTGNFGNVFAGYVASRLGLPIEKLVVATNVNDILHRALSTGRYEVRGVTGTISPSMDIQVSSNFERLIFEASGHHAEEVRQDMAGLKQSGSFTLESDTLEAIRPLFASGSCDEAHTAARIRQTLEESGYLADPHTAVGLAVAEGHLDKTPMVTLSTAHPAKFPEAVKAACGIEPDLPAWTGDLMEREEIYQVLPARLDVIEEAIESRSRAVTA
jgi:threonine synthase